MADKGGRTRGSGHGADRTATLLLDSMEVQGPGVLGLQTREESCYVSDPLHQLKPLSLRFLLCN